MTPQLQSPILLEADPFLDLCQANPDLKIEQTAAGELLIMPPTGGETGRQNAELLADFIFWNRQTRLGEVFDSSTCFLLPQGGRRSPDVAWVAKARWQALTPRERQQFPPLCPDFVLELLSPSDSLALTQTKMGEYLNSGLRLGWRLNPLAKTAAIYRPGQPAEILEKPRHLEGEDVLPGLRLRTAWLW